MTGRRPAARCRAAARAPTASGSPRAPIAASEASARSAASVSPREQCRDELGPRLACRVAELTPDRSCLAEALDVSRELAVRERAQLERLGQRRAVATNARDGGGLRGQLQQRAHARHAPARPSRRRAARGHASAPGRSTAPARRAFVPPRARRRRQRARGRSTTARAPACRRRRPTGRPLPRTPHGRASSRRECGRPRRACRAGRDHSRAQPLVERPGGLEVGDRLLEPPSLASASPRFESARALNAAKPARSASRKARSSSEIASSYEHSST